MQRENVAQPSHVDTSDDMADVDNDYILPETHVGSKLLCRSAVEHSFDRDKSNTKARQGGNQDTVHKAAAENVSGEDTDVVDITYTGEPRRSRAL